MNKETRIDEIKKRAMDILRKNKQNDDIKDIPNLFGIDENDNYYHMVLDYPGTRYKQMVNLKNDDEFVRYIVKETIYEKKVGRF